MVVKQRHCNVKVTSSCEIAFLAYSGASGSIFKILKTVRKKKNPLFVYGLDRKIRPSVSPFGITRQAL